jgi:hypothetical protein
VLTALVLLLQDLGNWKPFTKCSTFLVFRLCSHVTTLSRYYALTLLRSHVTAFSRSIALPASWLEHAC